MVRVVGKYVRRGLWLASIVALVTSGETTASRSADEPKSPVARFISFQEAEDDVALYAGSGLPGSDIRSALEWDAWIRTEDALVRSRVDKGVEDSISNFVLYGTSFTGLSPMSGSEGASDQQASLSPSARARLHALALALQGHRRSERLEFIREYFRRKKVSAEQTEPFLAANLIRFSQEQHEYQKKLEDAGKSEDRNEIMAVRGTLYENRGLSVDTSLLPNFAIEETLRALAAKGVLRLGSIRRIAIIGPGLDFTDKRDGYDFYPLQTIQPFAILDSVKRLGLFPSRFPRLITVDLNPAVNAHVARLSALGNKGLSYTVQLPREKRVSWSDTAVAYWRQFGDQLGTPVKPLPIPDVLSGVASRAVSIRPQYCAAMLPIDMNVVTQTIDVPEGQGFDLVVATNILVYYDIFQQALAMTNIAHLMNSGGIFVANNALPAAHDSRLKYLGRKNVVFARDGSYGDDVVVYQRQ